MDYRSQLIALAEGYATAKGISVSRVATLVMNHGGFFERLGSGGSCSVDTYLRVKAWFTQHWPESVGWPEGVDCAGALPIDDGRSSRDLITSIAPPHPGVPA